MQVSVKTEPVANRTGPGPRARTLRVWLLVLAFAWAVPTFAADDAPGNDDADDFVVTLVGQDDSALARLRRTRPSGGWSCARMPAAAPLGPLVGRSSPTFSHGESHCRSPVFQRVVTTGL
jgi:hypothetical protein